MSRIYSCMHTLLLRRVAGRIDLLDPRGHAPILAGKKISTSCRTHWDPLNIFDSRPTYNHALIILNRPIQWKRNLLLKVWEKAQARVTVDGGTDEWIKFLGPRGEAMLGGHSDEFLPDLVTGDMDSILPTTLSKLRQLGVNVIETPDQNSTDYTKALMQLGIYATSKQIHLDGIYICSDTCGRFDHIMANINTLFKADEYVGDAQVIQVASDSLTWLLRPGTHKISVPEPLIRNNSWCALIPIGSPVKSVTTTGLKWNLECGSLEFGHMVSTSNTYCGSPEVTISTDSPVLWSMDIDPLMQSFPSERAQSS